MKKSNKTLEVEPWVGLLIISGSLFFLFKKWSRILTFPEWSWGKKGDPWSPGSPPWVYQEDASFFAFPVTFVSWLICFYACSWPRFQASERHGIYINPPLSQTLVASLLWFNGDCKKWRINYSWAAKWYALLVYDFTFKFKIVTFFVLRLTNFSWKNLQTA